MSNRAPGEPTEEKGKTHDRAWGGTTVLQGQKGGTATRTAMRVAVRRRNFAIYFLISTDFGDCLVLGFDKLLN